MFIDDVHSHRSRERARREAANGTVSADVAATYDKLGAPYAARVTSSEIAALRMMLE